MFNINLQDKLFTFTYIGSFLEVIFRGVVSAVGLGDHCIILYLIAV